MAQSLLTPEQLAKREKRKNLTVKEWNADGTKAKQYNYLPNGKLYSVKVYEYIFSDK